MHLAVRNAYAQASLSPNKCLLQPLRRLALLLTIGAMILPTAMPPPAVAPALNIAFRAGADEGNLLLFGLAVGLVVLLLLQRGTGYMFKRLSARR